MHLPSLIKTIPNNYVTVNMINPDQYLISSILLETLSTTLLKKTVENKLWFIPTYMGYGISFYIFPKSKKKYSLSNAYTIWCSLGIILTTIIDYVFYKQIINYNKIIGIVLILTGIKIAK